MPVMSERQARNRSGLTTGMMIVVGDHRLGELLVERRRARRRPASANAWSSRSVCSGTDVGLRPASATTNPRCRPKYCTYWLESVWSGAKYSIVTGMPSLPDLVGPHRDLDRVQLEGDADLLEVGLHLLHGRAEVDAVDVERRVGGVEGQLGDAGVGQQLLGPSRRPARARAGRRCRRTRSGSATAGACRRRRR